jgi:hypothetical protein
MNTMSSLQDIVEEVDSHRKRQPGYRRIVVAGEFESGKSSVLNALLGNIVIPCNPGLPGRPLIKVSHSHHPMISAENRTGQSYDARSVADLAEIDNLALCDIRIPVPDLMRTEIIEVPHRPGQGIDPRDIEMMGRADMIVWVTIASQAWRLSEQAIMAELPSGSRKRSVLAISRADHLRDAEDWEKLELRLQKDAAAYFSEMVFMQASIRNLMACNDDESAWIRTGGPSLASIAQETLAETGGVAA